MYSTAMNALKHAWILAHLFLAQCAYRIVREQNPLHVQRLPRRVLKRAHHFFVFDEHHRRIRRAQRLHLVGIRQAGV
jgi:hypothetical protein